MRIVILTAGTGSYYCGTCMRDNALVLALRRQGHDAILVPMYLPLMLDETSTAEDAPLFYGGVNVYLQHVSRIFRKTPRWLDKLFDSPALLKKVAENAGMTTPAQLGTLTLSTLQGSEGNQAKELERMGEWLNGDAKADVICISNALLIGIAPYLKQKTSAKILCTLQGEDYFLDSLPEPHRTQCWETLSRQGQSVDGFIAVSQYYGDLMQKRANLPKERVHVVYNGIDLKGYRDLPERPLPHPPTIGYLARLNPLKGLHTLVEAYLLLRERNTVPDLRLSIAGTKNSADDRYLAELERRIAQTGLQASVTIQPNLSREKKIDFLRSLSVMSVPATYGESFGLYLLEAWACEVPVVQPRHAAFPELLEITGGGELCEPDSVESLADTLEALLKQPECLQELGRNGQKSVFERFDVENMAAEFLRVVSGAE
ncbi:glycosyl transferase family 1 [Armatimonadota bacterium]|nr:glycosyl transferase family 1 [Armatimonadota bacterium]